MFDQLYARRLKADLATWVENGWVSSDAAGRILASLDKGTGRSRLPAVLAMVGVICLALAVAAFVAANWEAIPRLVKLVGIVVAVVGANLLAAWAAHAGRRTIAELATVFAVMVFVSGLALVGQIYHLPTDWAGGAVLATLGALAAAWLTGSRPAQLVAAVAAITWVFMRPEPNAGADLDVGATLYGLALIVALGVHAIVWPSRPGRWATLILLFCVYGRIAAESGFFDVEFDVMVAIAALAAALIAWGLVLYRRAEYAPATWLRRDGISLFARSALDVGAAVLTGTVVVTLVYILSDTPTAVPFLYVLSVPPITVVAALALAGILVALAGSEGRSEAIAVAAAAAIGFACPLFAITMPNQPVLHAALALVAALAVSVAGILAGFSFWSVVGHLGVAAVVLWLLNITIGTLIGQSVFFLVAGAVLIGVAWASARLMRRRAAVRGEAS